MKVTDSLQLFCSNAGLVRLPQLQPAGTPSRELKMTRVKRKLELNAANVQNEKNHEPRDTSSDFSPHTEPESRGSRGVQGQDDQCWSRRQPLCQQSEDSYNYHGTTLLLLVVPRHRTRELMWTIIDTVLCGVPTHRCFFHAGPDSVFGWF